MARMTPTDIFIPKTTTTCSFANTFFNAGFIESWGRGYRKIEAELKRVGLPMPIVEEAFGGVKVTLKRRPMDEIVARGDGEKSDVSKNVSKNVSNSGSKVGSNNGSKVGSNSGSKVSNKSGSKRRTIIASNLVNKRQDTIVKMIKANPYVTAKEIATALSAGVRTIYRDLANMQKQQIIRHEGSTYAGIWVVLEHPVE